MRDMAYDSNTGPMVYPEPERTSMAAILGFLFSLGGCCFGVTALLGLPLSILGAVNVGRSNGRLGGRALAVAGIILGLLNLTVWGGCVGGAFALAGQTESMALDPAERTFLMLEQGQFDGARANMVAPGADLSDAELAAFTAAYQSTLGEFVSRPQGGIEYLGSWAKFGPWETVVEGIGFGSGQSRKFIPAVFTFQQGDAMVLIEIDQQTQQMASLTVYDEQLNEYEMVPGSIQAPAPTPPPAPVPTPDADPVDPAPVDPMPTDPMPTDPAPTNPAPSEPAP